MNINGLRTLRKVHHPLNKEEEKEKCFGGKKETDHSYNYHNWKAVLYSIPGSNKVANIETIQLAK